MPTFFTDRDLGPTSTSEVVRILRRADLDVECHADHFDAETPDHVWLEQCGERNWIPLTKDRRIGYSALAKKTIMESGVRLFVLIGKHPHRELAQNVVNSRPSIRRFLDDHQDPFIARLYKPSDEKFQRGNAGRIKMWLSHSEWLEGD